MTSHGTRWKGLKASNYHAAFPRGLPPETTEYDLLLEERDRIAPMKSLPLLIATTLFALHINAPAAEPPKDNQREQEQLLALAKEVQSQQATIAENQTKIDAKTALVAEALRQAKIYSSRSR